MIAFENIYFLWLLLVALIFGILAVIRKEHTNRLFSKEVLEQILLKKQGISTKTRGILLAFAFGFIVVAMARPYIKQGQIEIKSSFVDVVVGIDMSRSMFVDDVYPTRFEFAKKKFVDMLKYAKNLKISLIGFSTQTFLIAPFTSDFYTLEFLVRNLDHDSLNMQGTNILNTIETANDLYKSSDKKALLLFTDGGTLKNFDEVVAYAKSCNMVVYIYNIGTSKGAMIKDKQGKVVVVKANTNIKQLANQTQGIYLKQSFDKEDTKQIVDDIIAKFKANNEKSKKIKEQYELFFVPLAVAILLFLMAIFSMPNRRV